MAVALEIAAAGRKSDLAKPMKGLGPGVHEIALQWRGNAYRVVYVLNLAADIWVVHSFQKKSMKGIKTAKQEIETIRSRIQALKERLKNEKAQ